MWMVVAAISTMTQSTNRNAQSTDIQPITDNLNLLSIYAELVKSQQQQLSVKYHVFHYY